MNVIYENSFLRVERDGRFVIAHLQKPGLTLSTSYVNGGLKDNISHLINHQCLEGKGHLELSEKIHRIGQIQYHKETCEQLSLNPQNTCLMSTAANMANCTVAVEYFKELEVCAIATAGVRGNAGRAGDPASWHEEDNNIPENSNSGTINVMLFINWPLSRAALSKALMMLTEAKSAALWDLYIPSKYSEDLATGTGTDQCCIYCPIDPKKQEKHWSGHHSKLGESIGRAVKTAITQALKWQNGLEKSYTKNLTHALSRYGFTEEIFMDNMKNLLSQSEFDLLEKNKESVLFEPELCSSAYALASLLDRCRQETFPPNVIDNILSNQCSLMALSLSSKAEDFSSFRSQLNWTNSPKLSSVYKAIALGWQNKWK